VQYLGQHMQDANLTLEQMLPLLGERWQQAWERYDGATHTNYLRDVRRVAGLVRRINRATAERGVQAPALGTELWCSLIEASIRSLSGNVSPVLLHALVRQGYWSPLQGLAHVRQIAHEGRQVASLIVLGQVVPEEYLGEVQALARQIEDDAYRSRVLAGLIGR